MKLYYYQGQGPLELPQSHTLEDGTTIDLSNLSDEELINYGYYNYNELDINNAKAIDIDFNHWISAFRQTLLYKRIRTESLTNPKASVLFSEFALNCNFIRSTIHIINELNPFFFVINFTSEEISDFQTFLNNFELDTIFNIPDEEYLTKNYYDFKLNEIVDTSDRPFESWTWDGKKWNSPVEYPNDGNNYIWDESDQSWILL